VCQSRSAKTCVEPGVHNRPTDVLCCLRDAAWWYFRPRYCRMNGEEPSHACLSPEKTDRLDGLYGLLASPCSCEGAESMAPFPAASSMKLSLEAGECSPSLGEMGLPVSHPRRPAQARLALQPHPPLRCIPAHSCHPNKEGHRYGGYGWHIFLRLLRML
jgi:hypothetical protein